MKKTPKTAAASTTKTGAPTASRKRALLKEVPLFASLDDDARRELATHTRVERLPAGKWLFREGVEGDALYVVSAGRLDVISEASGAPRLLAVLGQGECVGELSLLCGAPRSASVRARRDSVLVRIDRATFDALMARSPQIAVALNHVLARRLHRASKTSGTSTKRSVRVVSVVSLDARVPDHDLTDRLVAYFSRFGSVALLGEEATRDAADATGYARLLDDVESDHDTVVVHASLNPSTDVLSSWTEFCLRQGDRCLLLAHVSGRPDPRLRARISASGALDRTALVLYGAPVESGSVGRWRRGTGCERHYLVDPSNTNAHVDRIGRKLSGRSVGVVLSGGGARGFAHVGVLEGLLQAGVTIDRVGGTSMGALIAGLFAMGRTTAEMRQLCERDIQRPFSDYTLPVLSLTRARKALKIVDRLFGDRRIDELPLDMFCLSADLLSATPYIHRDGELREAIACSAALPGLTPPRRYRDRLLVDGALLNNLPVDVMNLTGEGPVIASDVMPKQESGRAAGLPPGVREPPRWLESVTNFLGNQRGPIPTIVQTLMRSSVLGSVNRATQQRALADLVVTPDVSHITLLEFDRAQELFEAGRVAALTSCEQAGWS